MKTKKEFSAGLVVINKKNQVLLGLHSGYHKWVLPKGLIEKGEAPIKTAIRETKEEMGIKAKIVSPKPIHIEQYVYFADYKKIKNQKSKIKMTINNIKFNRISRRIKKYQEQGGNKTKVFKTVTFYLSKNLSQNPKNHGWEMSEVNWFDFPTAFKIMSFKGEKEALKKAISFLKKSIST